MPAQNELKNIDNPGQQVWLTFFNCKPKIVAGTFNLQQIMIRRDELKRLFHLVYAAEWVASSVNEQTRRSQTWQVLHAKLLRPTRRMQWVGQQQQS